MVCLIKILVKHLNARALLAPELADTRALLALELRWHQSFAGTKRMLPLEQC
jgi:hypothetical protein